MNAEYPNDLIDGRGVPPLVLTRDHVLGSHDGTVHMESGHLELRGRLTGTLSLHPGTTATISGVQAGTVSIRSGASVAVTGAIQGTTHLARGATLVIESAGRLAGTLHNDGLVIVRGVFGGAQTGSGELRLEDGGYIKEPRIIHGAHHYDW